MPVLAFLISVLTCVPMISGFYAKAQGRNFWKWYAVGFVLPIISVFILFFMDKRTDPE
ncbi:MAG: hypothetical protein FD123_3219 [Bacteroidetes bacterium]|nr:MAG: hypothetical protein FD123_3219 [Bacteroidota bacterium]